MAKELMKDKKKYVPVHNAQNHGLRTHKSYIPNSDSSAENTPNAQEFISPICLPKPKKFWISMKKGFIGRP